MTKTHSLLACLLFFLLSPALFPQSVPAAEGGRSSIWVGAEFSTFNPDWGCNYNDSPFTCWDHHLIGPAVFADVNRLVGRIGFEAEARWLLWQETTGPTENTYLVGPRLQLMHRNRFSLNAKFLAGGATFHKDYTHPPTWGGWAAYVPGGTIGYRMSSRIMIRGDYEYQMWPGFVGDSGVARGLTPNGFSVGASYRLFR